MNFGLYPPNSGRVVEAQLKVLIADITLTNSGSFEAIPIPAGFDHLEIEAALRSTLSGTADVVYLTFNGDNTAANYASERLSSGNASLSGSRADTPAIAICCGNTATSGDYGTLLATCSYISQPLRRRESRSFSAHRRAAADNNVDLFEHNWESTEPITSVTIRTDNHATDLFTAGSRVQVFGVGTFAVALAR
jgi:hypothetical protein